MNLGWTVIAITYTEYNVKIFPGILDLKHTDILRTNPIYVLFLHLTESLN